MVKWILLGLCGTVVLICGSIFAAGWQYPPLPDPSQYGDVVIDRLSTERGVRPVLFSHWSHRRTATCRVCHLELGFVMETNMTRITEQENKRRNFCGACHDGVSAFAHSQEHCDTCHNGGASAGRKKYVQETKHFSRGTGDFIDWSETLRRGLIHPKQSIHEKDYAPPPITKTLTLESDWNFVPPSVFPHKEHIAWLDCAQCHPDIFNVKKKTTEHFSMENILLGEFCGVCHLTVAFPIQDCQRCHPDMIRSGF